MTTRQPLPLLWLLSDARNDAGLKEALARLPRGSGFVFRHYHLEEKEKRVRFEALAGAARSRDHLVIFSGDPAIAADWGADGVYGATERVGSHGELCRMVTAHNGDELQAANDAQVDGVFLSPVFPTRSHEDAQVLGIAGFHLLAQQSAAPVIALGGMTAERACELDWPRWGAIDGLA